MPLILALIAVVWVMDLKISSIVIMNNELPAVLRSIKWETMYFLGVALFCACIFVCPNCVMSVVL